MRRFLLPSILLLALPLMLGMIPVPPLDVAGDWNLELTVQLPSPGGICDFGGYAQVLQQGNAFSGTAHLFLVSGDPECPVEMTADLSGSTMGGSISGTLEGGNLGTASFTGTLIGKATGPMSGNTMVNTGPFAGAMGTWAAQVGQAVMAIPTLSPRTLALLAGLLLAVGLFFLYRQRILG